mmetsp:Transcript_58501/g.166127  ORF Transcript_58501/g.166127 Transcript_58501/m.166127 type:complete len:350 (-) Transcript_58501:121-1170(-)
MARSAARTPVLAVFGAVGLAIFQQLQLNAFVSPVPSFGAAGHRSQSRVIRAASKEAIAEAERHAKLVTWAAKKAAEDGMPQAAAMKAKADQAVRAVEALKQQEAGGAPAPAVRPTAASPAAMDNIRRTIQSSPLMVEEITELEKQVKLLKWAAQTTAEQGMPQAAAAKARADQAVEQLMQLKNQQEMKQGGKSVTSMPVSPAPVAATAAAPVPASGVSKAAIAEAEKQAKLITWAAKKAAEDGMPQAAAMKAKADQAVRALEALKQQQASQPAPAPSAPAARAPATPAASSSAPTREELEQARKEMNLLVWAAKTSAEQGMPQAAMMKAKADAKVQEYQRMTQQMAPAR